MGYLLRFELKPSVAPQRQFCYATCYALGFVSPLYCCITANRSHRNRNPAATCCSRGILSLLEDYFLWTAFAVSLQVEIAKVLWESFWFFLSACERWPSEKTFTYRSTQFTLWHGPGTAGICIGLKRTKLPDSIFFCCTSYNVRRRWCLFFFPGRDI